MCTLKQFNFVEVNVRVSVKSWKMQNLFLIFDLFFTEEVVGCSGSTLGSWVFSTPNSNPMYWAASRQAMGTIITVFGLTGLGIYSNTQIQMFVPS